MSHNLISILGPTACGKTSLAAKLALHYNGEIISADSRQVYRYMDIGTGKDISEYNINGMQIAYHLIDIIDTDKEYNIYRFQEDFFAVYKQVISKNKIPFLTGGSGLYLAVIIQNYLLNKADFYANEIDKKKDEELRELLLQLKPNQHNQTDLVNRNRLVAAVKVAFSENNSQVDLTKQKKINSLNIGIAPDRELIKRRITERLKKRLNEGMIEEVEKLLLRGISHDRLQLFGLEYKYISLYLKSEINYNDMFQKLNSSIHKFAKRQMTWFRKMEKEGVQIQWLESPNYESAKRIIDSARINLV
ncbi:MAG: tRNA (adenosine(37)-N6)-dimethylallyltransferase MiaA [Ignavibacteria bacterium]|nr:tRNA (adenosine(37)-N6)-dimethylallyltransferase MiaA [Ignavibacteria bacterium]